MFKRHKVTYESIVRGRLADAKLNLLDAEEALELADATRAMYRERVARLTEELENVLKP